MKSGAEKETEKILLENYEKYYRLAYSYVKTEHDALDVVQESAYKAIRDCGKVRERKYIGTWIYRIVVNTALDLLRRQGREVSLDESRAGEEWQPPGEDLELRDVLVRRNGGVAVFSRSEAGRYCGYPGGKCEYCESQALPDVEKTEA